MPLQGSNGEHIITSHASKQSKINLILFEAHTSVLIPFMLIPAMLFTLSISVDLFLTMLWVLLGSVLVLIILERRGVTLGEGLKRIKFLLTGRERRSVSKGRMRRRLKINRTQ